MGSQHAADTYSETDDTLRAAKVSASRSLPTILDALVALGRARTQGADRWIDAPQR